jgi:hypothetical protein
MKNDDPTKYKQLLETIVKEAASSQPKDIMKNQRIPIDTDFDGTPQFSGLLTSLSTLFDDVDKFWLDDDKVDLLTARKQVREQEHMASNLANVNMVAAGMNFMTQEATAPRPPGPISTKQRASIFTGMKSRLSTMPLAKK